MVRVTSERDGENIVGGCSGGRRSERLREAKERDEAEVVEVEDRVVEEVWKNVKTDGEVVPLFGDVDGEVFYSDPVHSVVDWEFDTKVEEKVDVACKDEEVGVEAKVGVQCKEDMKV